jgi:plastin-1
MSLSNYVVHILIKGNKKGYSSISRNGLTVAVDNVNIPVVETVLDDEQTSREERAFRMWINSLGVSTYINNLFEDLRDG